MTGVGLHNVARLENRIHRPIYTNDDEKKILKIIMDKCQLAI
jgi:hypothetical protein